MKERGPPFLYSQEMHLHSSMMASFAHGLLIHAFSMHWLEKYRYHTPGRAMTQRRQYTKWKPDNGRIPANMMAAGYFYFPSPPMTVTDSSVFADMEWYPFFKASGIHGL